ncbi:hypothetical protein BH24CHL6_BH24CHL6_14230 [soil metagenome]
MLLCGPLAGCDTVNTSVYSEFMRIHVALFGALGSAAVLVGALAWWHSASQRGLLLAYLVGMATVEGRSPRPGWPPTMDG